VIATCRRPGGAAALQLLKQQYGGQRLQVLRLDTADDASIQAAAGQAALLCSHLDLLLNVSGVLHSADDGLAPETSVSRLSRQSLELSFQTNALGPLLVCQALLPLLTSAAGHGASADAPALIANLSARVGSGGRAGCFRGASGWEPLPAAGGRPLRLRRFSGALPRPPAAPQVGSIGDNRLGGWYSYRASKAALNQLTRTLALELERKKLPAAAVLLHPGTCDTGLSAPFQRVSGWAGSAACLARWPSQPARGDGGGRCSLARLHVIGQCPLWLQRVTRR
jgi:NAD(P)-dependent dehydrogenase (short-subunit alcohol dehydrogenase family)